MGDPTSAVVEDLSNWYPYGMARSRRCLFALSLLAISCSGSGEPQDDPNILIPGDSVTVLVAAATGGQVQSPGGVLTLDIAPGALDADTEITITEFGELAFDLQPEGLVFNTPATATVDLPLDSSAPISVPLMFPVLIDPTDGSLEPTGALAIEPQADGTRARITTEVPHFSIFELTEVAGWDGLSGTGMFDPPRDRWPALNQRVASERNESDLRAVYFVGEMFRLAANLNIDTNGERSYEAAPARTAFGRFRLRSGTVTLARGFGFASVEAPAPNEVMLGTNFAAGDFLSPIMVDFGYLCEQKGSGTAGIFLPLVLNVDLTIDTTVVRDPLGTILERIPIENPRTFPTTITTNVLVIEDAACITVEDRYVDALDISEQDKDAIKRAAALVGANTCTQSCGAEQACELTEDRCAPLPGEEPTDCEPPATPPELLSVTPNMAPSDAQIDIRTTGVPFFGQNPRIVFESTINPSVIALGALTSADSTLENIRARTPSDFKGNTSWNLSIDYQVCDGSPERGRTNSVPFTARTLMLPSLSYQALNLTFIVVGEPVWPLSVSVVPPDSGNTNSDFFAENEVTSLGDNRWQAVFANAINCPGGITVLPDATETSHQFVVADQINQRAIVHFACLE